MGFEIMLPCLLLACPACAYQNPYFIALSLFLGTVPVAYLFLRPYTQSVPVWGFPRVNAFRLASLAMLLLGLTPFWWMGRLHYPLWHVVACFGGLAACVVYLWWRLCWLLEARQGNVGVREVLFLGLAPPLLLIVGHAVGSWCLAAALIFPMMPAYICFHTGWAIVVGGAAVILADWTLRWTFLPLRANDGAPTERGNARG